MRRGPRAALAVTLLLPLAGAVAPAAHARADTGPIEMTVAGAFGEAVEAGSWLPVTVTLTDRGGDVHGVLLVTAGGSDSSGRTCFSAVQCMTATAVPVTYRVPVDLAAGVTKRVTVDLLAGAPDVHAALVDGGGSTIASADGSLRVAFGTVATVAVVSDTEGELDLLGGVRLPSAGAVRIVHLRPADVPRSAAALEAFTAVAFDGASTETLGVDQRRALHDYVTGGGSLIVAAGAGAAQTLAGIPPDLLPARITATETAASLSAAVLDAAPVGAPVVISDLSPEAGALTTGSAPPLAVEARRGAGRVALVAADPSAAPMADWPGTATLLRRLIIAGQAPSQATAFPKTVLAQPTLTGRAALLEPAVASIPSLTLPATGTLALLLLAYVVAVGPVNFLVLARLRRRELAWVTVPAISLAAGLVAYGTALGTPRQNVDVSQVRLVHLRAGDSRAGVERFAAVYVPHGGSHRLRLAGSPLVTGLPGLGTDSSVSVDLDDGTAVTVDDARSASVHGYAATGYERLGGTLVTHLVVSGNAISGRIENHLGAALTGAMVVRAGAAPQPLGDIPDGGSVDVSIPLAATLNGGSFSTPFIGGGASGVGLSPADRERQRRNAVALALQNGAALSADGTPALTALVEGRLLPDDVSGDGASVSSVDAVTLPLDAQPAAGHSVSGLPGQLIDAVDGGGAARTGVLPTSGGSELFRFVLPGGAWRNIRLTVSSGARFTPGGVVCVTGGACTTAPQVLVPGFTSQGRSVQILPAPGPATSPAAAGGGLSAEVYDAGTGRWDPVSLGAGAAAPALAASDAAADGSLLVRLTAPASVPSTDIGAVTLSAEYGAPAA